jgi:hypothetical protein
MVSPTTQFLKIFYRHGEVIGWNVVLLRKVSTYYVVELHGS